MSDGLVLIVGLALLGLTWSDRKNVRQAWRKPARWWRLREYWDARAPSQPLNLVLGTVLGGAAVVFGVLGLVT
jgi:RsiW-degrading membrane proteinase PrsW (M82 family)